MIRSYAPYSINFNLRDVTRTKHAEWAKGLGKNEIEVRTITCAIDAAKWLEPGADGAMQCR